jgi:hypothetical protein
LLPADTKRDSDKEQIQMRAGSCVQLALLLGSLLAAATPGFAPAALAQTDGSDTHHVQRHWHNIRHAALTRTTRLRRMASVLQCVPFARAESGIVIKGNAATWWDAAAGVYARGRQPEPGAVLNFRATSQMRLGHVAVVTNVLSAREIEVDHANWTWTAATHGNVTLAMRVIDVSPNNDWTAVRVELGHSGQFGAVYPTYGFIYDRPDTGTMIANTLSTLHPTIERPALDADEVAEAPAARSLSAPVDTSLVADAPSHNLR